MTLSSRLLVALVLVATCAGVPVFAQPLAAVPEAVVLRGQVVAAESRWDGSNVLYTYVTLDVSRVVLGSGVPARLVLKQLGGETGGIGLWVAGQASFAVGEDVLLELAARPSDGTLSTAGLARGKWQVERDEVTGAEIAIQRQDDGTDLRRPLAEVALDLTRGRLPLAAFRAAPIGYLRQRARSRARVRLPPDRWRISRPLARGRQQHASLRRPPGISRHVEACDDHARDKRHRPVGSLRHAARPARRRLEPVAIGLSSPDLHRQRPHRARLQRSVRRQRQRLGRWRRLLHDRRSAHGQRRRVPEVPAGLRRPQRHRRAIDLRRLLPGRRDPRHRPRPRPGPHEQQRGHHAADHRPRRARRARAASAPTTGPASPPSIRASRAAPTLR